MGHNRRSILRLSALVGIAGVGGVVRATERIGMESAPAPTISAPEDLMREHAVLSRLLLIYEAAGKRLAGSENFAYGIFAEAARLIRSFIHDYHEKLEERFIFPEFEKAQTLTDLVKVLRQQHDGGHRLTDTILTAAGKGQSDTLENRQKLLTASAGFIRMYRPHAARESTVLFPALYGLLATRRIDELGEQFEAEEEKQFGKDGFAKTVEQVAGLEKSLGIYDLASFTPA